MITAIRDFTSIRDLQVFKILQLVKNLQLYMSENHNGRLRVQEILPQMHWVGPGVCIHLKVC
jgi:hypothetical protein